MYLFPKAVLTIAALVLCLPAYICCPSACRCDERRKIVYCNERNLKSVPYEIPLDTKTLLLQGNKIESGRTLESKLGRLQHLERLDMHNNKLTTFPNNLPRTLVHLSLRLNRIKSIDENAISHLKNLQYLNLDSNNLTDDVFVSGLFKKAVSLQDLTLSRNFLNIFPQELPHNLKIFRISHNNVSEVYINHKVNLSRLVVLYLSHNNIGSSKLDLYLLQNLKTLDLNHNHLVNIPSRLPANLTELRLSSNAIQFIFAHSNGDHGDFQNQKRLKKLDLSSNLLQSIEEQSFDSLPISSTVELHDNPWKCDCDLLYLKRWLTFTTSVLQPEESLVRCSYPSSFRGVTLQAIDVEALTCPLMNSLFTIDEIQGSSVMMHWDRKVDDPPFTTCSLLYGEILCQNCSLHKDMSESSRSKVTDLISEYTVAPILPSITKQLFDLKPSTKYIVCVSRSHLNVDQLTLNQCQIFQTDVDILNLPTTGSHLVMPQWLEIVTGVAIFLLIAAFFAVFLWFWKRKRHRGPAKLSFLGKSLSHGSSSNAKAGLPLVEANREFVTLVMRQDFNREKHDCFIDAQNQSIPTNHLDVITLQKKHEVVLSKHLNFYEKPTTPSIQRSNRLHKSHDPGLDV